MVSHRKTVYQRKVFTCVYTITNTINAKRYVGSAIHFVNRKRSHIHALKHNKHHSQHLQNAWNKYGEESFVFKPEIICEKEELIRYEQALMDLYHPEYNIMPRAHSALGMKHSEETNRKNSERRLGVPLTLETRAKMSAVRRGRKLTPEWIKHIVEGNRGRKLTPEQRANISKAQTGKKRGPHKEETKRKIGESNKGKIHPPTSDETKLKLSEANKGRVKSPEECANISAGQKERVKRERELGVGFFGTPPLPKSEETRKKLSKANTGHKKSPKEMLASTAGRRRRAMKQREQKWIATHSDPYDQIDQFPYVAPK